MRRALRADTIEDAAAEWQTLFGNLWPDPEVVKAAVRIEAMAVRPAPRLLG